MAPTAKYSCVGFVTQFTYYRWRKEFGGLKGDQVKRLKELEKENEPAAQGSVGPDAREADPERGCLGKLLSPSRRRRCVDHVMAKFSVSERFACKVLGQHRSTQRKKPQSRPDEEALTTDIIRLASRYGRYGYRRITAMLRSEGWTVNAKRVERIWRREGLKVPQKQPKRGRLWLNDGSCVRLRPEHPNHVWSYASSRAGPTMAGSSACSTSSTSSPENVWRSGLIASSTRPTSSTSCRTCLSYGVPGHV